jgi:DNA transposition AAA+ family ATPase
MELGIKCNKTVTKNYQKADRIFVNNATISKGIRYQGRPVNVWKRFSPFDQKQVKRLIHGDED